MTIRPIATANPTAPTTASTAADTGDIFAALLALLQGAPGLIAPAPPASDGTTSTPQRQSSSKPDKLSTTTAETGPDMQHPGSVQPQPEQTQIQQPQVLPTAPVRTEPPDTIAAKVTLRPKTTPPVTRTPGHSELAPGHLTAPPDNAFGRERRVVQPEPPRAPGEHAAAVHAEKKTDRADTTKTTESTVTADRTDSKGDVAAADRPIVKTPKDSTSSTGDQQGDVQQPAAADAVSTSGNADGASTANATTLTVAPTATAADQSTLAPAPAITPALVPQAVREAMLGLRAANGTTRLVVRLDPPSLGNVHISLHADADGVRLALHVDNVEAAGALTDQRHHIESALHAEGLNLSDFTVDQQSSQWTGNFDAPARHNGEEAKRHTSQSAQPTATATADAAVESVTNEGVWL